MTAKESFQVFAKKMLTLALGLGLITGLVEGVLLFGLHRADLLTWRLQNRAIWYETLWIAPLVDLALFALAGGIFALTGWIFPRIPVRKVAWFTFTLLAVFGWLFILLFGKISFIAIIILATGTGIQAFILITKYEDAVSLKLRKSIPWLAGLTVALIVAIQGGGWLNEKIQTAQLPEAGSDTPNVIVIVVDTLRADHLSSYGYERDTSPFMDNLAAEGVLFETRSRPLPGPNLLMLPCLTGHYTYEHQAETEPLDDHLSDYRRSHASQRLSDRRILGKYSFSLQAVRATGGDFYILKIIIRQYRMRSSTHRYMALSLTFMACEKP